MRLLSIILVSSSLACLACSDDGAGQRAGVDSGAFPSSLDAGNALDAQVAVDASAPQSDASDAGFAPACRANDGRCGVCIWEEGLSQRCLVTDFQGDCPSAAHAATACPTNPVAACDRSPGYFDPGPRQVFADWDFYYAPVPADAQRDCEAEPSNLGSGNGRWQTY